MPGLYLALCQQHPDTQSTWPPRQVLGPVVARDSKTFPTPDLDSSVSLVHPSYDFNLYISFVFLCLYNDFFWFFSDFFQQTKKMRILLDPFLERPLRAKSTLTPLSTSHLGSCSSRTLTTDPPLLPLRQWSPKVGRSWCRTTTLTPLVAAARATLSQCHVGTKPPLEYPSSRQRTPHRSSSDTFPWTRMVRLKVKL